MSGAPAGRISGALLAVVWLAELGAIVTRLPLLASLATVGLAAFVLLAVLRASRHIRILFLLVTSASVAIALTLADADTWLRGFERAQIFGAFLPSVLLLRATADGSPRIARLREGIGRLSSVQARNWMLYGAHGLGAVLNVGAMAILAPVVAADAAEEERVLLAAAAARGVGTAVMWSPFFVSMPFISQLVPAAALWQTMLVGSGAALLGLAICHWLFTREMGAMAYFGSIRQLGALLLPTVVMVGTVVVATLAGLTGLQAVALMLPVLCFAYLATRGGTAIRATAQRSLQSFGRLADELLIVVGATVLGVVIGSAPQVTELAAGMTPTLISGAPLLAALTVVLVGLGQLGLHPMIGASIVVPIIAAGAFGIEPAVLVAAAVFAWGLSAAVSIWTLPVAVAATTFRVPVRRLYNAATARFAVLMILAGVLYFALLNAWLSGRG